MSDEYNVFLTLQGNVQNPECVRYLEQIGKETLKSFSTQDWLILNLVSHEKRVPKEFRPRVKDLIEVGALERVNRHKVILARRYYKMIGKKGVYTRKKGLDRDTNKALLRKHIRDHRKEGSPLQDLADVLPALSRPQIQTLLRELRAAGKAHSRGKTRAARWYPGEPPDSIASNDGETRN